MNFDELWRRNFSPREAPSDTSGTFEELELVGVSPSYNFAFDDLDEREINRFLEWLEDSFLSDEADEYWDVNG